MNKLFNWFRRTTLESDLNRELQYHLDRRVSDLMRSGMPEREARRAAELELGGYTQVREEVRDVWLTRWLRDFLYDLRFSARSFLRSPSFAATAVISLALGIGATTAIFSLVDQVLLHALPVREPQKLVLIDWRGDPVASAFGSYNLMSYPICLDLQRQNRFFEGVLCRAASMVNLTTGVEAKPVSAEIVSGTYFPALGVEPALGRMLGTEDDRLNSPSPVVVISYDYWKTELAGAPDVVGRKVLINQHPMTIVGVAAAGFRGIDVGEVPALWLPASVSAQAMPGLDDLTINRRKRWLQILGRLKPDVTLAQAQAGLQPWFKAMLDDDMRRADFPRITAERRSRFLASTLVLTPAPQGHVPMRRTLSTPLWVLLAATGVLLGLACLNVAGLFLARGSARSRELSTRLALGASRGRLGRQFLTDSLVLALAGGLLGLALAPLAMRTLIAFLPPRDGAATNLQSVIDSRLLAVAFFVSIVAGVLSGLAPALQAGRRNSLIASLRERSGNGFGGARLRKVIVTAQIALTLILVIGAMLFERTLFSLMAKGPGFGTSSLVSFGIDPLRNGYSQQEASRLIRRIHDDLRTAPNIQTSSVAGVELLNGGAWFDPMTIQARERIITQGDVQMNAVSPGFFATLGVKIVAGRNFDEHDSRPVGETGERIAIVNQTFVKRYLGGQNPIGVRIGEGNGPDVKPNIEIIGVVADFSYRGVREESEQAYFSIFEGAGTRGNFYVRVRNTPEGAAQSIRTLVRNIDPSLPITYFRTLDEQVNRSLNTERLLATLSTSFGTLALVLSLVGLYGVMSFVVTQRTSEIGIRLALGASRGSAIWLVLRDALMMIGAGTAIALPCAWAMGRLVESQLFGVTATDTFAVTTAVAILALAALGAAFIPAYRASTVNPTDALRFE